MLKIGSFLLLIIILIGCNNLNQKNEFPKIYTSLPKDSIGSLILHIEQFGCNGIPDSLALNIKLKAVHLIGKKCTEDKYMGIKNNTDTCCRIPQIPEKLVYLKEIEILNVEMNNIHNLPDFLILMQSIKVLDLSNNPTEEIDEVIDLQNLTELYLYNCRLKHLPEQVYKLKKLKILGLKGNPITQDEIDRVKADLPNCDIIF